MCVCVRVVNAGILCVCVLRRCSIIPHWINSDTDWTPDHALVRPFAALMRT